MNKESRLLFDKLNDYQLFKEYSAPRSKYVSKCVCVASSSHMMQAFEMILCEGCLLPA
jgi:hypothetical protein